MIQVQTYLIFVLLPMYLLGCIGLAQFPMLFKAKTKTLYLVNYAVAIPVFGWYESTAHVGFESPLTNAMWGGALAALMSTAFAVEMRRVSLWRLPRGVTIPPDYPAHKLSTWDP